MFRSIRTLGLVFVGLALMAGCRTFQDSTLTSDYYRVRKAARYGLPEKPVYVLVQQDTLQLWRPQATTPIAIPINKVDSLRFYRFEADVDVFTLPFKIRPARAGVPPQLNSNFNAALYIGRRIDFYRYQTQRISPSLVRRHVVSQGIGYGFFAGIGSSTINSTVTRGLVTDEYEGVIADAGLAVIYDASIFNVGLAAGLDHLFDRNQSSWIYHRQPWFGILFGLNLN
ncbi:hypothetical protein GCM10027341_10800 [Spirosoma knui]